MKPLENLDVTLMGDDRVHLISRCRLNIAIWLGLMDNIPVTSMHDILSNEYYHDGEWLGQVCWWDYDT